MKKKVLHIIPLLLFFACQSKEYSYDEVARKLAKSAHTVELSSPDGKERLLLSEQFQGRILTSTFNGKEGQSLGWLNPDLWKSEALTGAFLHGEERMWIGPLGGQFSFYYGQESPINEDNWTVPATFNDDPFRIVSFNKRALCFEKRMSLTNYKGHTLNMLLKRNVNLLSHHKIAINLNMPIWDNSLNVVAYEVNSQLYNSDSVQWDKDKGLASIWDLTTLKGSDQSFVIIPLKSKHKHPVNTYLNPDDDNRIAHEEDVLYYKVDGKYRHKIGVKNNATKGLLASYCPKNELLTIIQFQQNVADSLYFNSLVAEQDNPYLGETISVYNHGDMDLKLGELNAFYELETASAMRELKPGECISHFHRVYHFGGEKEKLSELAEKVLGVSL